MCGRMELTKNQSSRPVTGPALPCAADDVCASRPLHLARDTSPNRDARVSRAPGPASPVIVRVRMSATQDTSQDSL